MNKKIVSKFEVIINGQVIDVPSLSEAEKKLRSCSYDNEFEHNYIIRKDYDEKGKLLETYYTL